jgi:hypothetical protein
MSVLILFNYRVAVRLLLSDELSFLTFGGIGSCGDFCKCVSILLDPDDVSAYLEAGGSVIKFS